MYRFDLNGWKYGVNSIEDLAEMVRPHAPDAKLVLDRGGKAFGLSLAQALGGDVFSIPRWFAAMTASGLPSREQLEKEFFDGAFIRSNAPDEDWVDPRAGLHESHYRSFRYRFDETVQEMITQCSGVVLQGMAYGVGVVIDLGWSELLSRNVLRVALGRPSQQGGGVVYTSPTWDNEAWVGIFDAHTGEAIIDLSASFVDLRRIIDRMVNVVVPRLMRWNIQFGLQFEFLAELNKTRDMLAQRISSRQPRDELLQVRPSPGALQGKVKLPTPQGELLATTGKVNQPGSAQAEIVLIEGHNRRGPIDLSRELHLAGEHSTEYEEIEPIKPLIAGKIVLWDDNGALERYGGSFYQVLGAWRLGAIAQLSGRAIFINSAHGTSLPTYRTDGRLRPVFDEARSSGLLVVIEQRDLWDLGLDFLRKNTPTLQIVSDGLVGQVYRL